LPPADGSFCAAWGCGGAFCGDGFRSARAGPGPAPPSRGWRAASSRGFGSTTFCCSRASRLRPVVCGCSFAAGAAAGFACRSARAVGGAARGVDACAGACRWRACCGAAARGAAARAAGAGAAAFGAFACGAGAARAAGPACAGAACPGGPPPPPPPPPPFGAPAAGIAIPAERMIRSAVMRVLDCNMTPAPALPSALTSQRFGRRAGSLALVRALVSRFRSSHHCAARSFANFGIDGH
jgi:hypothetical protein